MESEQLLALWKQTFGEHEGFWEMFLETGFSRDRCLCLEEAGKITAALCWFDCHYQDRKWAYLYAVVTHPDYRGRGLCRRLMDKAHSQLKRQGYAGALLVPAEEDLREMYRKMGYETCSYVSEFACAAGEKPLFPEVVAPAEYTRLRRKLLPEDGVIQEGGNLCFLSAQAELLAGEGFLLAAWQENGMLHGMELLGDVTKAPEIVKALGCTKGTFRIPGGEIPFAMGKKFREDTDFPSYFGFAFD